MPFKNKEAPKKTEMTSMIDMIFLLLIFFLVTLSVSQKGGGTDSMKAVPRQVTIPKSESQQVLNEVDKIIQIDDSHGVKNVGYYIITSNTIGLPPQRVSRAKVLESIEPGDAISIRASDSVLLREVIDLWDIAKNQRKAHPVLNLGGINSIGNIDCIPKPPTERP